MNSIMFDGSRVSWEKIQTLVRTDVEYHWSLKPFLIIRNPFMIIAEGDQVTINIVHKREGTFHG